MALCIFRRADGTGVAFDAVLSETHATKSAVTRFPVEAGASVADHVRPDTRSLSITGVVGAFPLVDAADALPASDDRAKRAFDELERMQADADVITVITSLKTYASMIIESMSTVRSPRTSATLEASIVVSPVVIATSETITVPTPKTPRATSTSKDGRKVGEDVDTPAPSLARQAARGLARLAGGDAATAAFEKLANGG